MSEKRRRKRGDSVYRRRTRDTFEDEGVDELDEFDDDEDLEVESSRSRRRRPKRGGRRRAAAPAGGRGRRGGRRGPDWGAAEDDDYEDDEPYDDEDDDRRSRRRRRPAARAKRASRKKAALIDLCSPVFGFAAILPRGDGGIEPSYEQFRQGVLLALQRIRDDAEENGIDKEDAEEAVYALSLFLDEQVATSTWSGRENWAAEPLGMVLINDPEGGVNFFSHLDALAERQVEVKKIYLICVAMGFRGKHVQLDEVQQASRLAEIRRKIIRSIHPKPLDKQEFLFPEGYTMADPIEDEAPAAPRLWIGVSAAIVVLSLLLWGVLFWRAGRIPAPAEEVVERALSRLDPDWSPPPPAADDGAAEGTR
ncbi:MAG: DotU family type IV/VI secretion system protein [Acidobacteriota bacterium]|jgi:type VI secretion system protein ImpK